MSQLVALAGLFLHTFVNPFVAVDAAIESALPQPARPIPTETNYVDFLKENVRATGFSTDPRRDASQGVLGTDDATLEVYLINPDTCYLNNNRTRYAVAVRNTSNADQDAVVVTLNYPSEAMVHFPREDEHGTPSETGEGFARWTIPKIPAGFEIYLVADFTIQVQTGEIETVVDAVHNGNDRVVSQHTIPKSCTDQLGLAGADVFLEALLPDREPVIICDPSQFSRINFDDSGNPASFPETLIECVDEFPTLGSNWQQVVNNTKWQPTLCETGNPDFATHQALFDRPCAPNIPPRGVRFEKARPDIVTSYFSDPACRVIADDIVIEPEYHDGFYRFSEPAVSYLKPVREATAEFDSLRFKDDEDNIHGAVTHENELLGIDHFHDVIVTYTALHDTYWNQYLELIDGYQKYQSPTNDDVSDTLSQFDDFVDAIDTTITDNNADFLNDYKEKQTQKKAKFDPVKANGVKHAKQTMSLACNVNSDAGTEGALNAAKGEYESSLDEREAAYPDTQTQSKDEYLAGWADTRADFEAALNATVAAGSPEGLKAFGRSLGGDLLSALVQPYKKHQDEDVAADKEVQTDHWDAAFVGVKTEATKCQRNALLGRDKVEVTFCETGHLPEAILSEAPVPAKARDVATGIRPPEEIRYPEEFPAIDIIGEPDRVPFVDPKSVYGQACGGRPGDPQWAFDCSCSCNDVVSLSDIRFGLYGAPDYIGFCEAIPGQGITIIPKDIDPAIGYSLESVLGAFSSAAEESEPVPLDFEEEPNNKGGFLRWILGIPTAHAHSPVVSPSPPTPVESEYDFTEQVRDLSTSFLSNLLGPLYNPAGRVLGHIPQDPNRDPQIHTFRSSKSLVDPGESFNISWHVHHVNPTGPHDCEVETKPDGAPDSAYTHYFWPVANLGLTNTGPHSVPRTISNTTWFRLTCINGNGDDDRAFRVRVRSGTSSCTSSFPSCGGSCPAGSTCQSNGTSCACVPDTTSCGGSFPSCNGSCSPGSTCQSNGSGCTCVSDTPSCGSAAFPQCGGTCSFGSTCQATGGTCACVPNQPTCGDSAFPQCGGTCTGGRECGPNSLGFCVCTLPCTPPPTPEIESMSISHTLVSHGPVEVTIGGTVNDADTCETTSSAIKDGNQLTRATAPPRGADEYVIYNNSWDGYSVNPNSTFSDTFHVDGPNGSTVNFHLRCSNSNQCSTRSDFETVSIKFEYDAKADIEPTKYWVEPNDEEFDISWDGNDFPSGSSVSCKIEKRLEDADPTDPTSWQTVLSSLPDPLEGNTSQIVGATQTITANTVYLETCIFDGDTYTDEETVRVLTDMVVDISVQDNPINSCSEQVTVSWDNVIPAGSTCRLSTWPTADKGSPPPPGSAVEIPLTGKSLVADSISSPLYTLISAPRWFYMRCQFDVHSASDSEEVTLDVDLIDVNLLVEGEVHNTQENPYVPPEGAETVELSWFNSPACPGVSIDYCQARSNYFAHDWRESNPRINSDGATPETLNPAADRWDVEIPDYWDLPANVRAGFWLSQQRIDDAEKQRIAHTKAANASDAYTPRQFSARGVRSALSRLKNVAASLSPENWSVPSAVEPLGNLSLTNEAAAAPGDVVLSGPYTFDGIAITDMAEGDVVRLAYTTLNEVRNTPGVICRVHKKLQGAPDSSYVYVKSVHREGDHLADDDGDGKPDGLIDLGTITANVTFRMKCDGPGGISERSHLDVTLAPAASLSVDVWPDDNIVEPGQVVKLWYDTNPTDDPEDETPDPADNPKPPASDPYPVRQDGTCRIRKKLTGDPDTAYVYVTSVHRHGTGQEDEFPADGTIDDAPVSVGTIGDDTTYELRCHGSYGTAVATTTVQFGGVEPPDPTVDTVTLQAVKDDGEELTEPVGPGDVVRLKYVTSGQVSGSGICHINKKATEAPDSAYAFLKSVPPGVGTEVVGSITMSMTYRISCVGDYGGPVVAFDAVTFALDPPPSPGHVTLKPIDGEGNDKSTFGPGEGVHLKWDTGPDEDPPAPVQADGLCRIYKKPAAAPDWAFVYVTSVNRFGGEKGVGPITQDMTYAVQCFGSYDGEVKAITSVTFELEPPADETVTGNVNINGPPPVAADEDVELKWWTARINGDGTQTPATFPGTPIPALAPNPPVRTNGFCRIYTKPETAPDSHFTYLTSVNRLGGIYNAPPIEEAHTYLIRCHGSYGSVEDTVVVDVSDGSTTSTDGAVHLVPNLQTINHGDFVYLEYKTEGVVANDGICRLFVKPFWSFANDWVYVKSVHRHTGDAFKQISLGQKYSSILYKLTCKGSYGTVYDIAGVHVTDTPLDPEDGNVTLDGPIQVGPGEDIALNWQTFDGAAASGFCDIHKKKAEEPDSSYEYVTTFSAIATASPANSTFLAALLDAFLPDSGGTVAGDASGTVDVGTTTYDTTYRCTCDSPGGYVSDTHDVTVETTNDKPIAETVHLETPQDTDLPIDLTQYGWDPNGDPLTHTLALPNPQHGVLSATAADDIIYSPDNGYTGIDAFAYRVSDGELTDVGTVNIVVAGDTVEILDFYAWGTFGDSATVGAGESIALIWETSGATQCTAISPPNVVGWDLSTWPPDETVGFATKNVHATEPGIYELGLECTGPGGFDEATFTLIVPGVNITRPSEVIIETPFSLSWEMHDHTVYTGQCEMFKDGTSIGTVTPAPSGEFQDTVGLIPPDPPVAFSTEYTLRCPLPGGDTDEDTQYVWGRSENQAPIAEDDEYEFTVPNPTYILPLNARDPDNGPQPLTYTVTQDPAHGTWGGTLPNLEYTPDANYKGPDQIKFTAFDGLATSNEGTVDIIVGNPPEVDLTFTPGADIERKHVEQGGSATIHWQNTNVSAPDYTCTGTSAPANAPWNGHGFPNPAAGQFEVTIPDDAEDFATFDFTLTCTDEHGNSAEDTVTIITGPPPATALAEYKLICYAEGSSEPYEDVGYVEITAPPCTPPTINMSVNPSIVAHGEQAVLSYTIENGFNSATLTIKEGGAESSVPLTANSNSWTFTVTQPGLYTIEAVNDCGSDFDYAVVNLKADASPEPTPTVTPTVSPVPGPPIVRLFADETCIPPNTPTDVRVWWNNINVWDAPDHICNKWGLPPGDDAVIQWTGTVPKPQNAAGEEFITVTLPSVGYGPVFLNMDCTTPSGVDLDYVQFHASPSCVDPSPTPTISPSPSPSVTPCPTPSPWPVGASPPPHASPCPLYYVPSPSPTAPPPSPSPVPSPTISPSPSVSPSPCPTPHPTPGFPSPSASPDPCIPITYYSPPPSPSPGATPSPSPSVTPSPSPSVTPYIPIFPEWRPITRHDVYEDLQACIQEATKPPDHNTVTEPFGHLRPFRPGPLLYNFPRDAFETR